MPRLWRLVLATVLLAADVARQQEATVELPPQDGFYNNLYQSDWGIVGSRLSRNGRASYSDGAYQMSGQGRPNPLDISQKVHSGQGGTSSRFGRNAMTVFFTQLVLDDILSTGQPGCPPEYENLPLPADHPLAKATSRPMVFQRSAYDHRTGYSPNAPRQQTNTVTSFLDGGVIYGTSRLWTSQLRSFKDGHLMTNSTVLRTSFPYDNTGQLPLTNHPVPGDHSLKPVSRLFAIGNAKGHESPFLLALQIVWHRYHNYLAADLKVKNPGFSDERIFALARKRVIATFQNIVVTEWLPAFLNGRGSGPQTLQPYGGYNGGLKPGVAQEFRTASNFRYTLMPAAVWTLGLGSDGTSTVPKTTEGRGPNGETRDVTSLRLCNQFWDSQETVRQNLDEILRGMIKTLAENEDEIMVPDLREAYYGPYEFSRQDIVAMEIQRDRDHGVGDLNSVLQDNDLQPVSSWADMGRRAQTALGSLYLNDSSRLDDVDFFTGAMTLGDDVRGIPRVFRTIILQQFAKIRESDRFWFENEKNGLFSSAELQEIRDTTFSDVLLLTTKLTAQDVANVFVCPNSSQCLPPPRLDDASYPSVDVCSPLQTYDYFTDSELSFAISFAALFLVVPVSFCVLLLLAKHRERMKTRKAKTRKLTSRRKHPSKYKAREWQGATSGERNVYVEFDAERRKVMVRDGRQGELRFIDLRTATSCGLKTTGDGGTVMALVVQGEVDLILRFEDSESCGHFVVALRAFLAAIQAPYGQPVVKTEAEIKGESISRDERQDLLSTFFREACIQIMDTDDGRPSEQDPARTDAVMSVRLTRTEFAEAMGVRPSSVFVRNVFLLVDTDRDGFISFQEFRTLFYGFVKGTANEKAKLMFNIYDVRRRGILTRDDFITMIRSLLDLSGNSQDIHDDQAVTRLVDVMFREAGIQGHDQMTFDDFKKLFASSDFASTLQAATLYNENVTGEGVNVPKDVMQRRRRLVDSYRGRKIKARAQKTQRDQQRSAAENGTNRTPDRAPAQDRPPERPPAPVPPVPEDDDATYSSIEPRHGIQRRSRLRVSVQDPPPFPRSSRSLTFYLLRNWVNVYAQHIFWVTLYTLVTCGIFIERAYFYAAGREHAGLRRLSGAWTSAMIRGSASVIMFTFASLLVTMCRNIITRMRETILHRFIPFDYAVAFHKYIALLALIATVVHIVGHGTNLYCMCTQSTTTLNCLFRENVTPSNGLATFHYWAFQTITGLTGVLVTVVITVMYVFAHQWARRRVFHAFWFTHSLYPLAYVLTLMHGMGRLVQDPLFPWYLLGPLLLFVLDRLLTVSRSRIQIPVIEAQLLPSDVLKLVFKRPANFSYKSGQWVRIACLKLGDKEYHPFTLSSAPHERHLSLHIRAIGPWTTNLRKTYDSDLLAGESYPKIYLDGPFGEGHQDWYSCDVAVLVGGGIGVTPFASIIKDIAFKSRTGALIACQKVYFIWVTRTQKSFEWLTDVIREAEDTDTQDVLDTHIFVTQFKHKYDLRTTMLYICERHFHKVEGRSLFTGLKATTHFGRPDFVEFLYSLQLEHPQVQRFGVFSCGPGPMTSSVQSACSKLNKTEGATYTHHYENF